MAWVLVVYKKTKDQVKRLDSWLLTLDFRTMKTVVITGANAGIGLETARKLDKLNFRQIWLVRNIEKTQQVLSRVNPRSLVTLIECDLSDMRSVRKAANQLNDIPKIDVLINNAGEIFDTKKFSKHGFELTFATNYLGHFFLTVLLLEKLISDKARVIFLSSEAYRLGSLKDLQGLAFGKKKYSALITYGSAKLAIMNFMSELHRRYHEQGLSIYALHPGTVDTGFAKNKKFNIKIMYTLMKPFFVTAEDAAHTPVFLASETGIENLSGNYFKNGKPSRIGKKVTDKEQGKELWDYTEGLLQPFLKY